MQNPSTPKPVKKILLVFLCIPVSPGNSRLIFTSPRNFGVWIDRIVPRWIFHLNQNLVLDSDLYLLHVEVLPGTFPLLFSTTGVLVRVQVFSHGNLSIRMSRLQLSNEIFNSP